MEERTFRIEFFQIGLDPEAEADELDLAGNLAAVAASGGRCGPVFRVRGSNFEMRQVYLAHGGYFGVLGKIRTRNLPHAAKAGGRERELNLDDDEGLIEKSHFFIRPQDGVIALQRNRLACSFAHATGYLTQLCGGDVTLLPIMQADAMGRLAASEAPVREIQINVARPSGVALEQAVGINGPSWDATVIRLMAQTGAFRLKFTLAGNGYADDRGRHLHSRLTTPIGRLMRNLTVKRARVILEPDGEEPGMIDLLQDRITAEVTVTSTGKYPDSDEMWNQIRQAWNDHRGEIRQVLGD